MGHGGDPTAVLVLWRRAGRGERCAGGCFREHVEGEDGSAEDGKRDKLVLHVPSGRNLNLQFYAETNNQQKGEHGRQEQRHSDETGAHTQSPTIVGNMEYNRAKIHQNGEKGPDPTTRQL